MSSASKNKGKRYEREVAIHLSAVFGFNFCRVPNSGAFVGGRNDFRRQFLSQSQVLVSTGDIIVPDELKNIAFECKNYKEFAFSNIYTGSTQLDKWITQGEDTKKPWFLMFKINREGSFVVYDSNLVTPTIPGNYSRYGKYTICAVEGFFEANKDYLLKFCSQPILTSNAPGNTQAQVEVN